MQFPKAFLDSLTDIKGFHKEAFEKVHASAEQITSIRVNPRKSIVNGQWSMATAVHYSPFTIHSIIPWTDFGYYLTSRPSFTFDPLFHAGCYYVQEASSMFLEQALKQTVDLSKPLKILDLCAAPGGKSTHIQSLITKESLLVSNEVIKSRVNILKDNMIRWGCENVVVTNNDPKDFSKLENYFDVIIVDAPCSGSGLFRKEPEAMEEWSTKNVQLCSRRQQRILGDVWPALKRNGILIYSTCSYSKEEDEEICNWLMNDFSVNDLHLSIDQGWGIVQSGSNYRFWPDKVRGEGLFIACFQKKDGDESFDFKIKNRHQLINKIEISIIERWIKDKAYQFSKSSNLVYARPEKLAADINYLSEQLNVKYAGIAIGELIRDKLIPHHALAMSDLVSENIPAIELNYDETIEFLKKKDLKLRPETKGWCLVNFKGRHLGWINVLENRINNYYPKELRILKDR